ncbi:hypothetical protein H6761_00065 [Candidatus Nomurabacteria bacterium]|nr:hypothetical protein [Candidatus Nomurabacteria bacterium]
MLKKITISLAPLILIFIFITSFLILDQKSEKVAQSSENITIEKTKIQPDYVRAIYLTAYSAGQDDFRKNIIEKIKKGKINSVVIDIKDYSGYILYDSQLTEVQNIKASTNQIKDVKKVIKEFHEAGIYLIARQTVFQDPLLSQTRPDLAFKTWQGNIWQDNKGLSWLDPSKEETWDYNLAIAREASALGFDEINFDYMRYPSDGNMANLNYNLPENKNMSEVMSDFFKFLSENLSNKTKISIDMFGLVMDHTTDNYDLNIGQRLVDAADYFDYVYPMMYPSHYPLTYLGFENSAQHPGAVISYGLKISAAQIENKRAKIRPWLQAFNIGAIYDSAKINAQTEAAENATSTAGWALWNARNYYPDYIFN